MTSMLGSVQKQIVNGLENIPEEISQAFRAQKKAAGGRLLLPDVVKMLQAVASSLRTFVCIDALDEWAVVHRVRLLDSLKQILEKSESMRIFIIGRPHIRAEAEKSLAGRVMSVPVSPSKGDITEYLRVRPDEDPRGDGRESRGGHSVEDPRKDVGNVSMAMITLLGTPPYTIR